MTHGFRRDLPTGWIPLRMRILIFILALSCGVARAADSPAITTLQAVHVLNNAEAGQGLAVDFEASVTYYQKGNVDLFVQDGDAAIYVQSTPDGNFKTGDRVLVRGKTRASFRPEIVAQSVTLISHGIAPAPVPADFGQMIRAEMDCRRVTAHARVRSADLVVDNGLTSLYLELLMDGGYVDATVGSNDARALKNLLDSDVEITGVVAGKFDSKNQLTGILLEVPSLSDVTVLQHAPQELNSMPVTPMDEILKGTFIRDLSQRVRVRGTITYYQPGSMIILQSGAKSLPITTQFEMPLRIGDMADVSGFPTVSNGGLALTRGEIQDSHIPAPVSPRPVTAGELASGASAFDLVSVEGTVVMYAREAAQDEYVLASEGHLFSGIYRHLEQSAEGSLPPMREIPVGSRVRLNGICMLSYGSDPFQGPIAFDVLMRSFDDIEVVAKPPLLNTKNLVILICILLPMMFALAARGWISERKVRRQTAEMGYSEKRRSRILEDINGSRPLAEIIEQITELTSFKLKGAPCWCQAAEGTRIGNCPAKLDELRVVRQEIPARSGPPLGEIYAAFDPLVKPRELEIQALSTGAALAAIAIETRRVYSDLLRRSELDPLTDVLNRFSLDRQLDAHIEQARREGSIFGLIYIDLDQFKQVNDLYGHQVGDRYLQEIARRMKRQLRPLDLLARIGGDEFAALVPKIHSRAEVEEIAERLRSCFEERFVIENYTLQGSASIGIALYPENGESKEALLNTADGAMYSLKNSQRQVARYEI